MALVSGSSSELLEALEALPQVLHIRPAHSLRSQTVRPLLLWLHLVHSAVAHNQDMSLMNLEVPQPKM